MHGLDDDALGRIEGLAVDRGEEVWSVGGRGAHQLRRQPLVDAFVGAGHVDRVVPQHGKLFRRRQIEIERPGQRRHLLDMGGVVIEAMRLAVMRQRQLDGRGMIERRAHPRSIGISASNTDSNIAVVSRRVLVL